MCDLPCCSMISFVYTISLSLSLNLNTLQLGSQMNLEFSFEKNKVKYQNLCIFRIIQFLIIYYLANSIQKLQYSSYLQSGKFKLHESGAVVTVIFFFYYY